MPREYNPEQLQQEMDELLTPESREWLASLFHDHVSNLVTNLSMQIEILNKMHQREMDLEEEIASLKTNVGNAASHIVGIEKIIRAYRQEE